MNSTKSPARADKRSGNPREDVRGRALEELELAGGVEGGMEAGSAGGTRQSDVERADDGSDHR